MKAIVHRLRRLENAAAPAERERAAAEAILEARRRRLGADYDPIRFPAERYAGFRTIAGHIVRGRELRMEQQAGEASRRGDETGSQHGFREWRISFPSALVPRPDALSDMVWSAHCRRAKVPRTPT
jgi:hypothetical protein